MRNLKQAIRSGDLDRFIAEREAEDAPPGDKTAFKRAINSMAQKSTPEPGSKLRRRDD